MKQRRITAALLSLLLICFAAQLCIAEIVPSRGQYEYYTNQFGMNCVVLCQELTVREGPSYEASTLAPLTFGDEFTSTKQDGDWLNIVILRDGSKFGWVRSEYVLVDPAFYVTEVETPIFAFDGADSPRVALLGTGERLPIIKETDTGYFVSLRGACGFIRK